MGTEKKTEFSLLGLAVLLKEHGFRVTAGKEVFREYCIKRDIPGVGQRFCKVRELNLSIEPEKAVDGETPSLDLLALEKIIESHGFRVTARCEVLHNWYLVHHLRGVGRRFQEVSEINLTVTHEEEVADAEKASAT